MKLKKFKSAIDKIYKKHGNVEVAFARDVNKTFLAERIYIWEKNLNANYNAEDNQVVIWIDRNLNE